jgi:hypothetical protein
MGELTLDMGPGSEICTLAFGMGGVRVMVVVRVARRLGVTLGSTVPVALGAGLLVVAGLNARGVWVSSEMALPSPGIELGEAGGKSAGVTTRVVVGSSVCPAWTVSSMTVGM